MTRPMRSGPAELLEHEGLTGVFSGLHRFTQRRIERIARRARYELQKPYLRLKYGHAAPEPYTVFWIDPDRITHRSSPSYYRVSGKKYGTFVVDGDWDIEESGGEWEVTPIEEMPLLEHFSPLDEFGDPSAIDQVPVELRDSYEKCVRLCERIQREGYQTQRELGGYGWPVVPEYAEIRVNIGRDGTIYFDDGSHRFTCAKLLDLEQIPVRVFVRHEKWQHIRINVATEGRSCLDAYPDIAPSHPDLADVL